MGQSSQLVAASTDLHSAAGTYAGVAAELETMAGTMSGIVHGLTSEWSGLGSAAFVTAWKAAARDAFRTIDALGGTSGAMTQLANTIDDNIQAVSLGESMDEQVPHGMNFAQRLSNAETQASQAIQTIQSQASSLAGQLKDVVVPLTTGGCSTGFEPLPPGGFDGVTVQPQPAGPNGPGGMPPGLVALMDGGGSGGGKGVGLMHLLASLGVAGYQTWPDFRKDGFLSTDAWEHFMINFTVAYSVGPESSSLGKFAGFSSIEALLQTMPDIQEQIKDKNFDPTSVLYLLAFHTATNMSLDAVGDKAIKPVLGDDGKVIFVGLTEKQIDELAGDPEKLKAALEKAMAHLSSLPPNDTSVPSPSPGPPPIPPGSKPSSPSPSPTSSSQPQPMPSPTP